MNRVILVGRLTKDPELRYTPNGVPTASFSLAINRPFTNQQGERDVDFINCVVWRKQAENVANYLKKGSLAAVDGRIQTRNYEGKDGKRVYITEVIAESVQFLDSRSPGSKDTTSRNQENQYSPFDQTKAQDDFSQMNEDPYSSEGSVDLTDDDLPF